MRDSLPLPRKWAVVLTSLLGVATAVIAATGGQGADLSFAALNEQVQGGMSVFTPLIGILLVHGRLAASQGGLLWPSLVAAIATNSVIACFGLIVSAATVAMVTSGGAGPWHHTIVIVLASLLVQAVATMVGTGFGLLFRWKVVAFLATIVFPSGLWLLLGAFDALRPAQPWLTPLAIGRRLLSGQMSATAWAQWAVMALIWGVALNAAATALVKSRRQ